MLNAGMQCRREDTFDVVQKGGREALLKSINGSLSNEEHV